MRTAALTLLYRRYVARSSLLAYRFSSALPSNPRDMETCIPVHRDGRAYLVVRLQHLWGEFSRELIVRSALGGCITRTGRNLVRPPNVGTFADISKITGKPMAGPGAYWDHPNFAIARANDLKVANYNEINLGLASAGLTDIRCVRNFLVHPNQSTNANFAQLTKNSGLLGVDPDTLLAQRVAGGATIFETWIADLLTAAWNAVE